MTQEGFASRSGSCVKASREMRALAMRGGEKKEKVPITWAVGAC